MPLLIILALCFLPLPMRAQSVSPPLPLITKDNGTVIHPTPYRDVLYDQYGNSVTIYQQLLGFCRVSAYLAPAPWTLLVTVLEPSDGRGLSRLEGITVEAQSPVLSR